MVFVCTVEHILHKDCISHIQPSAIRYLYNLQIIVVVEVLRQLIKIGSIKNVYLPSFVVYSMGSGKWCKAFLSKFSCCLLFKNNTVAIITEIQKTKKFNNKLNFNYTCKNVN